ncbi:hypothetical protein DGG96_16040 [Legionella qingyii]|uniref:Uncharacterized protein n=1 Tax=Legionella qingyii TaxID=2184757 RepID=A0A317TYF3_9GAMM|nr:hypothetical protein [Legionella qingyii]PWY54663.1 hypothetical protein DGG96_16040 [Legionella qingyii]RUR20500.1 hypothetical protein ELY20_14675 [Legionella qingyii]RUR21553.1 hypothetical protein ELY16_16090 [Legionella qingyii]
MPHFFNALNPLSKSSGINYRNKPLLNILMPEEIPDLLTHEFIQLQWNRDLCWYETIDATYVCLVGDHYDYSPSASQKTVFEQIMTAFFRPYLIPVIVGSEIYAVYNRKTGIKGALDFLIFPLVARKLIADTWLEERKNTPILNGIAWAIAIPLEVLRHSLALALTIALIPIVSLIHIFRSLINNFSNVPLDENEEDTLDLVLF